MSIGCDTASAAQLPAKPMPQAGTVTLTTFLDGVQRSGLLDPHCLDAFLTETRPLSSSSMTPGQLAEAMIHADLITRFQAEQLLRGKWRGFFLGKYRVLERLATGGMSNVYLCEHQFMGRPAAVKVPLTNPPTIPGVRERFEREARATGQMNHPNVVCAHDAQQAEDVLLLALEYVDGCTLRDLLTQQGPMPLPRAAHYLRQAGLGLQHVHEAGIVHRDIKPGNLLLDRAGTVKLFDFGLARLLGDESNVLTQHDIALGTADYIAPEQARDSHRADLAADIYSLGATFYHLLTGRAPFVDGTVNEKLHWQQTQAPPPVRDLRPEIPPALAAVVERMMEKDPSHRYRSAAAVADALAPWTRMPVPPPSDAEMPPRRPTAWSTWSHLSGVRWQQASPLWKPA
jgi:serine/threonine protein kinase